MADKAIPEYQIVRTERELRIATQVTLQVTRHSQWYCPLCGIPYSQEHDIRQRCDTCGSRLEEY